jgi:hypothetical protein
MRLKLLALFRADVGSLMITFSNGFANSFEPLPESCQKKIYPSTFGVTAAGKIECKNSCIQRQDVGQYLECVRPAATVPVHVYYARQFLYGSQEESEEGITLALARQWKVVCNLLGSAPGLRLPPAAAQLQPASICHL